MWELAQVASLVLATLATGLQAGLYYAFSCAVMPGLRRADDQTLVATMQHINTAIINPWFMVTFLGAPLLSALAVGLHVGSDRSTLIWVAVGFALAAGTVVTTAVVNVPLNRALDTAGAPDQVADLADVRAAFEATWTRWNTVRACTSTGSLLALTAALVMSGPWSP